MYEAEIVVREATHADYADVIGIGDVYQGRDYLRAKYTEFLDDPDFYSLVAVANGRAIGFYCIHILDNGQTALKRAGRVHVDWRGRGIFHLISEKLNKRIEEIRSSSCLAGKLPLTFEDIAVSGQNQERAGTEYTDKGFRLIMSRDMFNLSLDTINIKNDDVNADSLHKVFELTTDQTTEVFTNKEACKQNFPENRLILCWVGFRLVSENVPLMINKRSKIFASLDNNSTSEAFLKSPTNNIPVKYFNLFSFSHFYEATDGLVYYIELYGQNYNRKALEAHILKHTQEMKNIHTGGVVLTITYDVHFSEGELLQILDRHGINSLHKAMERKIILLEKNL